MKKMNISSLQGEKAQANLEDKGIGLQGMVANKLRAQGNTNSFGAYGKTK
jgi:hypothetical protein